MTQAHDPADAEAPHTAPRCPYCGATTTEPLALFGKQLLTVQMYCLACHTPFEYVKDDAILETFEARKGNQP
ncbi:MAG TPA: hypothetical protein VF725_00155 [Ktedonobacterales bacterium]|jgi:hypothetical protein